MTRGSLPVTVPVGFQRLLPSLRPAAFLTTGDAKNRLQFQKVRNLRDYPAPSRQPVGPDTIVSPVVFSVPNVIIYETLR